MTPEKFVTSIVKAYQAASNKKYSDNRIQRLKQPSISAIAEDLFACYMANQIKETELQFYIEPSISFYLSNRKRAYTIIPDLIILKEDIITHYFDLKIDIGFNRDLITYFQQKNERINAIRNQPCYSARMGKNSFYFSHKLVYQLVLITAQNGGKYFEQQIEFAKKFETIKTYILTTGIHPNAKNLTATQPDIESFASLIEDTRNNF